MSHRFNNCRKRIVAVSLAALLMFNPVTPAWACGPSFLEPLFVLVESPDLPFTEFTAGKLGIVRPSFGRKTLAIAFRYLNGGSFTSDEQKALVFALRAKGSEEPATDALKLWIATRKEFLKESETLPAIYVEQQRYGGYDFFPNCTPNAFEVATETLKARVASYGADDKNVKAWLTAQDTVFQNCSSAGKFPEAVGAEAAEWLRKDRDYQIAAAHFYSLNFDQARTLFAAIALDPGSPWQETADYLVGRTWVRQASLTEDEAQRDQVYRQAELYLEALRMRSNRFARATHRLLGLVKYRLHPEERVGELGRVLAYQSGNENLGQDLIDYVWLVDKFETEKLEEIEKRKNAQKEPEPVESDRDRFFRERREAISAGRMFEISIYPNLKEGAATPDYSERVVLDFERDTTEAKVIQAFETETGRKLSDEELKQIKEHYKLAMADLQHSLSPNRKLDSHPVNDHKGCSWDCDRLSLKALPEALRGDDLSDWMLTFQTNDPAAYLYAFGKWRETKSEAWLALLMTKAQKTSPRLAYLMRHAERVQRDSPAFATITYHLVRLKISLGQPVQARTLLDDIISWQADVLPISAQNQFLEQRMRLSKTLDEFLEFSKRRPVTFYEDGRYGLIQDLFAQDKNSWNPEYHGTKEEYELRIEKYYAPLLPLDNQPAFDDATIDIFNWHFPLSVMADVSRHPALPANLRRRFVIATWTRAIVLKQPAVAQQIAPELLQLVPEVTPVFQAYLDAQTPQERDRAALFVLLKFPSLSPLLASGVPRFEATEDNDYYLELGWWCEPSDTEYNMQGEEVRKVVTKPVFLTVSQLEAARRERAALVALGDAKSLLGKKVIAWAKSAPEDPRIPEALYIAVQATSAYKNGCSGWSHDQQTRKEAENILRLRYPQSPWTAKLRAEQ